MNSEPTPPPSPPSPTLVMAAFAAVYIVWGSTYLAIRVAVETIPPLLMAGCRFVIAGLLLFGLLRLRGVPMPTKPQWRDATLVGTLLLLGGNGLVVWAEQTVPSSVAALVIATTPVWFALLDWLRPNGVRPELRTVLGIGVGFLGVGLLVTGHANGAGARTIDPIGVLALVAAGIAWAGGSLVSRHTRKADSPWMNTAMQMICGGVVLLVVAMVLGEGVRAQWSRVSAKSIEAFIYLIVFGSWVGFSAYVWLLKVSTPAKVSTYAYVNPVIAVFLGWALLGESLSGRTILAALIIVVGVVVITLPKSAIERMGLGKRRTAEVGERESRAQQREA